MTPDPNKPSSRAVLERYLAVLGALTALAENEGALLEAGQRQLPLHLVRRKESLVGDYVALTAEVRRRASTLRTTGLLDPAELEARIRRLVSLMKENQRYLNAKKVQTAERVEAVMRTLRRQEPYDGTGPRASVVPFEKPAQRPLPPQ